MSKKKDTWLSDIEVYPNLFFLGIRDYKNNKRLSFEISMFKDQRFELYEAMKNFDGYFVTFNGIYYDSVVINYIIKDFEKLKDLPVLDFLRMVKNFSNLVIEDDFEKIKWYRWFKTKYIAIDLFTYWSKMLRMSKKISLKSLGIQLGHPEVQELPYEHTTWLNEEEITEVKRYNEENDLGVLQLLFNDMKEEISLRHYINTEYKLPCWSMDAPKIASELLLKDFCEQTLGEKDLEDHINSVRKTRYDKGTLYIKNVLDGFDPKFELPVFKNFFNRVLSSTRDFNETFPLNYGNTSLTMSYGIGGAHSIQSNQCYKSDEENIIVTSDYALIQWRI